METAVEEETYSKVIYIIIGILALIVFVMVLDILGGGHLIRNLTCAMVFYLPLTGTPLSAYLGCGGIAM